jgi:hypothetical protein
VIIIYLPPVSNISRLIDVHERLPVQQLVTQLTVERLDISVLPEAYKITVDISFF